MDDIYMDSYLRWFFNGRKLLLASIFFTLFSASITPAFAWLTYIDSGTDPASLTIGPGSSATSSDSFRFYTNTGTDTISAVVVNLGSVANASVVGLIEITSDNGLVVYGSSTNPINATTSISLNLSTLTATTSAVQYKIRITPRSHAGMSTAPNGTYTINAKIDSWTGVFTSYSGSDTGGTTLTVDNNPPTFFTDNGVTWTSRTSAANYSWYNIAYGKGLFVAIACGTGGCDYNSGGRIMTSPDGITWTHRTTPQDSDQWRGITYANGLFVAVAWTGTYRVMTSPDGINWTLRASPVDWWLSVTYGNGLYVATSYAGAVMTSPDGINWTLRSTPAANIWVAVTYGNGLFVAVAQSGTGNRIMTSPDGITWTARTSPSDQLWNSVTYGNGIYVAVAQSGGLIMTSPDGITWTLRTNPSGNSMLNSVIFGNGLFVIVAQNGTGNRVMTSPDGITWTTRTGVPDHAWTAIAYGNGMFVAVACGVSSTTCNTTSGNRVMTSGAMMAASSPGYGEVMVNYSVPSHTDVTEIVVLRSTSEVVNIPVDGTTYTAGNTIGASTVACVDTSVVAGGEEYCMASGLSNGTNYYFKIFAKDIYGNYSEGLAPRNLPISPGNTAYVTDGTDPVDATVAPGSSAVIADAFTIQIFGGNKSVSSFVVNLGSASGISLVEIVSDNGATVYGSVSNPTNATTTINVSGFTATNVATQYKVRITPKSHANMPAVPGGVYLIKAKIDSFVESGSFGHIITDVAGATITIDNQSPPPTGNDLDTWTARASASDLPWSSVAYGNGIFVAVANQTISSGIMTSSDGITWTTRTTAANNTWTSVTYGNGLFVAVSQTGTGNRVMTSPDGITWTSRTSAADKDWRSVTYGNGLFVAVSGQSPSSVMTSPDGVTWTTRTAGADNFWYSVTYGNGLFVAVSSTGPDRVMTSPDGIAWTARPSAAANSWRSVTYGNGLFVAVSNTGTGNRVMTSPDGITWTSRTSAADNSWNSITYGNGLFVAVAGDGIGKIMSSADGVSWNLHTGAVDSDWQSITYGNGLFVAVSQAGVGNRVMTSGPSSLATPGNGQVSISYSVPGDSDIHSIIILRYTLDIPIFPTEGVTYSTGDPVGAATVACVDTTVTPLAADSCIATGLNNGTAYHFRIFARDTSGNYSELLVPTGSPARPNVPITLGNGTDPASASIAPGGSATMAGAFTLQTSSGTDTISSVVVNLGSAATTLKPSSPPAQTAYALTSGSSWTVPSGVTSIKVWAIGAGGGGAGAIASDGTSGGAGGAGGIAYGSFAVSAGSSLSYSIGGAGTGGTGAANGGSGGLTSITINGIALTGQGGSGGSYNNGAAGAGGSATGGTTNGSGGNGSGATGDTGGGGGGGLNGANGTSNGASGATGGTANDTQGLFAVLSTLGYATTSAGVGGGSGSSNPNAMNGTAATGFGAGGGGAGYYGGNGGNGRFGGGGGGASGYTATQTGGTGGAGVVVVSINATSSTDTDTGIALVEITSDNGAIVYGSSTNPTGNTVSVALTGLVANTAPTQYKIRITPKSHANMPAVPGGVYTVNAKVDSFTSLLVPNGSDSAGTSVSIDNASPLTVGEDVSTWTSRTSAADNQWRAVTYGNGIFVAVSDSGTNNRVMTSPDGITWTSRTSASNNNWVGLTYGNGLFVAVAETGTGNRVMTSPDGITWTSRTSAADNNWIGVTYGNGLFVAVSTSGTGNRVMTSPDGITWTLRTSAADNSWMDVTYGNGLFVAVAQSGTGNRVMTSSDGITWTSRTSAADNAWYSVTYGNGLFVAVSASGAGNRVMTSPDGITWTSRTSAADNEWRAVTYGNGLFVAVAWDGTSDRVMTSPDGITWTLQTGAADNYWRSVTYGNGLFVAVAYFATGNRVMTSGTIDPEASPGYQQATVTYTGSADSDLHSIIVLRSTSAVVASPVEGVTYSVGNVIGASTVVCVNTVAPRTSGSCTATGLSNGTPYHFKVFARDITGNYSTGTVPLGSPVTPGLVTTLRSGTDPASASIAPGGSATPAGAFTFQTSSGTDTISSIVVNLGSVAAAQALSLVEITSDNGVTVYGSSANPANATTSIALTGLTANTSLTQYKIRITPKSHANMPVVPGGMYTVNAKVESWSGTLTKTGTDTAGTGIAIDNLSPMVPNESGITWTGRTASALISWQSVTYGNGLFVAVSNTGTGNRVMTSPDGITWTSRTSAADNSWRSVTYGNGLFVAVAITGTGNRVMTSPDGITWTSRTSAADNAWNSVTYGNGLFVAVSSSGTNNRVMTSPDGITWTSRTSAADNAWQSVTYGNGLFVAVACGVSSTTCNPTAGNNVMTSPDGFTWTIRAGVASTYWNSVTYGNGLFVAVGGYQLYAVMTSPDGITWTSRTPATANRNWQSVTYGNGLFAAVACGMVTSCGSSDMSRIMTSPDGITWTTRSGNWQYGYSQWRSVVYGRGKFVGVAQATSFSEPYAVTSDFTSTSASAGDGQVAVYYTAPDDTDFHSIVVLRSTSEITDVPAEGTGYSVGNTIGGSTVACVDTSISSSSSGFCTITGLVNGTSYHLKVFAKDTNGNYSEGLVPNNSPAMASSTLATLEQSGYVFRNSSSIINPGSTMAANNTAATTSNAGDAFRLRVLLHAGSSMGINGKLMKLQYAQKVGTCDVGFAGETYGDVTNSTPISFYDTTAVANNTPIYNTPDITHSGHPNVNQAYHEANPFSNIAAIGAGQDGKFEFSLYDNNAPANTSYCMRIVNVNGDPLNTYTYIPEITTANQQVQLTSYRMRKDDGDEVSATYNGSENGSLASAHVVGDRLRVRFVITNIGSARTNKSYKMEYATSTCTSWTQVPKSVDMVNQHWKMESSSYAQDNGATTHSSGMSVPAGKTFVSGVMLTNSNTTPSITLTSSQYTEVEYSIRSTSYAVPATPYCFRVSSVEGSTFTYPVTPQVTPAPRVFRYQGGGGGGGGGSQSASAAVEAPASTATSTVTGGGTGGGAASSTESTATSTNQTSTSTPNQGGGGGDVGFLLKFFGTTYAVAPQRTGMVLGASVSNMCANLKSMIMYGSRDSTTNGQVSELQYFLQLSGYFNSKVTGYFGSTTEESVKRFQRENGLPDTGVVGWMTRGKMKQLGCFSG